MIESHPSGPEAAPEVRIIVVNFNGGDCLRLCLAALQRQTCRDFEVVVVDNASSDGSLERAWPEGDARFTALPLPDNRGFAAANNLGAAGARGRWLITLNPDAYASEDWLERLLAGAAAHPDCLLFGSTQLLVEPPARFDGTGDFLSVLGVPWRRQHGWPVSTPYPDGEVFAPCAAAAMYQRQAFEAVGGFDERFFCYLEDVDLALRLRLGGARVWQVGEAVVRHVGSAIVGRSSDFAVYHSARNQLWLMIKDFPAPLLLFALPAHLLALAILVGLRYRSQARVVARGVRDALRGMAPILASRAALQANRHLSAWQLARLLVWDPRRLLRKS